MHLRHLLLALLPLPAWAAPAPLPPTVIDCPAHIEVKSTVTAPAGWAPVAGNGRHPLSNVTMFAGPPIELASLVPTGSLKRQGVAIDFWTFLPNPPEPIYLGCSYHQTGEMLSRPVGAGVTRCETHYKPSRPELAGIRCSP